MSARAALPGRQEDREAFVACLESAIQGKPKLLVLEGEPGSGKTSLLQEIAASPLLPRRRIRVGLVTVVQNDEPDFVARAARATTRYAAYARVGGRRRFRAMLERLGPEWLGAIPGPGDLLEAITTTAAVIRRRRARREPQSLALPEDVEELLRRARRQPIALLIDDVQHADEEAVKRFDLLLRGARTGTRLVIVAGLRTPSPGKPKPPMHRLLARLSGELLEHRRLEPLSRVQIAEWLADRFTDEQTCETLVNSLFSVTGGQPGPIHDLLAQLRESGAIREVGAHWETDEAALAAVTDATAEPGVDLGGLSETANRLLHAASIFGDEFDGLALAGLLDLDELVIEDQLATAVRQGVIQITGTVTKEDGDLATAYRFASSTLRAALARHLDRDTRNQLQARLAGAGLNGEPL